MWVEKRFEWCLKQGKKGEKHKGLKKIRPDKEESKAHVEKALHNLRSMEYNIKGGFTDWAASAAFYAMYHAILALLYRLGYESRNQECSINAVEYFIENKKIDLDLSYMEMVRLAQRLEGKNDAKSLREEM